MPYCYQCNDNTKEISTESLSRQDYNLPVSGFVFSCFNANYKISPKEFDIWMRLLDRIEGSVLWLFKSNEFAVKNICKEAEKRNISSERLIFAERIDLKKHLARHNLSDLALDTFNYNGHTTTSDALWAGLPVLTKIGESFSARVSASLLNTLGLYELITNTEKEYEEKAFELANDQNKLLKLKSYLQKAKKESPLFDSRSFTHSLEKKYKELRNNIYI